MSGFEYSALDATGRETRGVVEADTERHARALLRERGLAPLAVEGIRAAAAARSRFRERFSRPGLSRTGLALLTRQFATLVRAGLTLEECLNVLIEQSESAGAKRLLAAVRARILEGQSLSRGLADYPGSFPQIYRAMVEAGEQSGKLGDVLERLADYTENREALRDKVVIAFIYPALVTVVALAVVGLLLVYVVPQVTRVFANLGQTLPLATRILIAISDFVRASGAVRDRRPGWDVPEAGASRAAAPPACAPRRTRRLPQGRHRGRRENPDARALPCSESSPSRCGSS